MTKDPDLRVPLTGSPALALALPKWQGPLQAARQCRPLQNRKFALVQVSAGIHPGREALLQGAEAWAEAQGLTARVPGL